MSEMKTPKTGQFWFKDGVRVLVRWPTHTGRSVTETMDGWTHHNWDFTGWHHEPRCDSFDWQEPPAVDPGEGYELLTDPIRELGDEWFDGRRWRKSNPALAGSRPSEVVYRRKVETTEAKPPEPEFCTACGVHSVVPGTTECDGCAEYVSLEGTKVGTVKITPVDMPDATIAMLQPMQSAEFFDKFHPVESPDDWVEITDPNHMPRDGVDWFNGGCNDTWVIHEPHHCRTTLAEYQRSCSRGKFRCRRKDLPAPVPSVKRMPVRLWVHQDSRNDERYNVFVKITPPAESNLYREILCDADGFFLEATE